MADIFLQTDVLKIFEGKRVLFLGDSILRNIYQDLLWLIEDGNLTPTDFLKKKGVQIPTFCGDHLKEGTGKLTAGHNYREVRHYYGPESSSSSTRIRATFSFITRCYSDEVERFLDRYKSDYGSPDLILVLSSLWDINRWGEEGIDKYIANCRKLLEKVDRLFHRDVTQLIWLTCPPIAVEVRGGFMVKGLEFQQRGMRFNVMEGNQMVAHTTAAFGYDVVDLHYWMTHQIHKRMPDGIHWAQDAVRLQLNIILTHFCLSWDIKLPNRWGGERNRPLESAIEIAEAADGEPEEFVGEDEPGRKRQRRNSSSASEDVDQQDFNDNYSWLVDAVTVRRVELKESNEWVEVSVSCPRHMVGRRVMVLPITNTRWSVKECHTKLRGDDDGSYVYGNGDCRAYVNLQKTVAGSVTIGKGVVISRLELR